MDSGGGLKPLCSLRERFAPAFAEAASRRQAEAFPGGLPMSVRSKIDATSGVTQIFYPCHWKGEGLQFLICYSIHTMAELKRALLFFQSVPEVSSTISKETTIQTRLIPNRLKEMALSKIPCLTDSAKESGTSFPRK